MAVDRRLALAGLVVVGGLLRLRLAGQELFADELATYWIVTTHGLAGVVETVASTAEITPPLSFLLTWSTTRLGDAPLLLRLPALVAGIATIPLVHAVGVRTVGRGPALLAAALTTLSPFMVYYSAEARGYGLLMAFVLVSTYALLRGVDTGGRAWWALYAAASAAVAYSHYSGAFVLAAQAAWALGHHRDRWRPLVLANAAAAAVFAAWLPSMRGDLGSPTTVILGALSPTDWDAVRLALGQWAVGFPAANLGAPLPWDVTGSSLRDLPGLPALVLLTASLVVSVIGAIARRSDRQGSAAVRRRRFSLVVVLAVASPVGAALQSAVGTNVFRTRTFAASWPYLALAFAAVVMSGSRRVRVVGSGLAVGAFALASITMLSSDFDRPRYDEMARIADAHPGGVLVHGAAYTPGPLTDFDVAGVAPDTPVLRLNVPAQDDAPFTLQERRPVPAEVAAEAVATAKGGPITVVTFTPPLPVVDAFIDHLPPSYELVSTTTVPGLFDVQALVFDVR